MTEAQAALDIKAKLGDREWRMDNLYYIQDKAGNKSKFKRNRSQMKLWDNLWYLNVILKDRQRGFSTLIAIIILDTCLFNSNTTAGIIDISLPDAKKKLAKIKYAYDNLPDWLKAERPLKTDAKESLEWANDSSCAVGTSHRGGTLQILHISEHGKIAARHPDKAQEIRTGALNTVAPGQLVFIESTAEGTEGEFFEICREAEQLAQRGVELTELDYKFHFFGWWEGNENELDPGYVVIPKELTTYFDKLETTIGQVLGDRKRAWYFKKSTQQRGDMKREYPSTPKEAFEATIDGSYFSRQMTIIRKKNHILRIPIDPRLPVNTFWDLGVSDDMVIWFHQLALREHRFINYYEDHGEGFAFYARILREFSEENDIAYGQHFAPHDIEVRSLDVTAKSRKEHAASVGINFETVARVANKADGIEASRRVLPMCYFDEENCAKGIKHLDNYKRLWDDKHGIFKNKPLHNQASHGADGFQTFSLAEDRQMIGLSTTPHIPTVNTSYGASKQKSRNFYQRRSR